MADHSAELAHENKLLRLENHRLIIALDAIEIRAADALDPAPPGHPVDFRRVVGLAQKIASFALQGTDLCNVCLNPYRADQVTVCSSSFHLPRASSPDRCPTCDGRYQPGISSYCPDAFHAFRYHGLPPNCS